MTTRVLALRMGKTGDNQRFSTARARSDDNERLLTEAMQPGINPQRRIQLLSDPTHCYQFLCRWTTTTGFITRPSIETMDNGNAVVAGSYTDTIGQCFPVSVPVADFQGYFTTLVPRGDAERLGLAVYPIVPDTVAGPPAAGTRNAQPTEPSMERLNFPLPEPAAEGDRPVIAALPVMLPVGRGQTCPHSLALNDAQNFQDTFYRFQVWRNGVKYCVQHNDGRSVTRGGPLFHLPALALEEDQENPFADLDLRDQLLRGPDMVAPHAPLFGLVSQRIAQFSDDLWVELGSNQVPEEPVGAPGGGVGLEQLRTVIEPLTTKEKTYRLAERTKARYRVLLASRPEAGSDTPNLAVLPALKTDFEEYLSQPVNAAACDDLKELVRQKIVEANASTEAWSKAATMEADNVTLAFSDRLRACVWVVEALAATSHTAAKGMLGMLQFLTPDRRGVAEVMDGDAEASTLVMANAGNATAQLDASKSSKMYCGGKLETFHHCYEAVGNLILLFNLMVADVSVPMVLVKLREYAGLLVDRRGRILFETYAHRPHLAIHAWQDLQHILSAFLAVATSADIYGAVMKGNAVDMVNFTNPLAVADRLIADLRAVLFGNGLGKFDNVPVSASWFSTTKKGQGQGGRGRIEGGTGDSEAKRPRLDGDELERKKQLGVLTYDSAVGGNTRLPTVPVFAKSKGSKVKERLCMRFLTRGYVCTSQACKFPHISNINTLPEDDRNKLVEFVRKQPGLAWAPGKEPAGTT